jgi:formate hydrogenlyase subunit 6/NADH:ubiquinone oxidoreductase subunit I
MASFKIAKVILKSLFKKPATLMYPVVEREWQERTRGQIGIEESKCIVCGICAKKCPANAIMVERKDRTWAIERMQCVQCNSCVEVCPKKCLVMENQYTEPGAEKITDVFDIPEQEKKKAEKPKEKEEATDAVAEEEGLQCDLETCVYCGICAKECPSEAIKVDRKEKSWEVDKEACTTCGICVEKCPKDSLEIK